MHLIDEEKQRRYRKVSDLIRGQAEKKTDFVRGKLIWRNILETVPADELAEILSMGLSAHTIQWVEPCTAKGGCCGRRC